MLREPHRNWLVGSGGQTVFVLLLLSGLFPVFAANSEHAFALFMDERITFEPVSKVLKGGFDDVLTFCFDGKDARYGRLMWNLDLMVSYLPFQWFGEQGQIMAVRYCHAFTLLFACILMGKSLQLPVWLQWMVLGVLILIPPAFYYMLMPKPEPLIILVLALIIHYSDRKNTVAVLVLSGVLAGLKLSVLPLALMLTGYVAWHSGAFTRASVTLWLKDFKAGLNFRNALLYLFLSACMAVLLYRHLHTAYAAKLLEKLHQQQVANVSLEYTFIIVNALLAAGVCIVVLRSFRNRKHAPNTPGLLIGHLISGFAISNPFVFFTPYNAALYLLTPVAQGSDNMHVDAFDWLQLIYEKMFFGSAALCAGWLICIVFLLIQLYRKDHLKALTGLKTFWFLLLILVVSLLPLLLFTKRLWDFYLLIPMLSFVLIYALMLSKVAQEKILLYAALLPLLVYAILAFPIRQKEQTALIGHTKTKEYRIKVFEYLETVKHINAACGASDSCTVYWDPALFFPDLLSHSDVKLIWGPFRNWGERKPFVVLKGKPESIYQAAEGSVMAKEMQMALDSFKCHARLYRLETDSFRYYKIYRLHENL